MCGFGNSSKRPARCLVVVTFLSPYSTLVCARKLDLQISILYTATFSLLVSCPASQVNEEPLLEAATNELGPSQKIRHLVLLVHHLAVFICT